MSTACISKIPAAALERYEPAQKPAGDPKVDVQRCDVKLLQKACRGTLLHAAYIFPIVQERAGQTDRGIFA